MGTAISTARGRTTLTSLLTLAAVVLALFGNLALKSATHRVGAVSRAASNVLIYPLPSQTLWVSTMDPAIETSIIDGNVDAMIYAGLMKQVYDDRTGRFTIVPDLAAGMPTISSNGLVYTFKIRPDARFSDGTPVTAQDFVWSFQRVLNPIAASPTAYYLGAIKGANDYNAKKLKSFSDVGVKALDARTLQITLAQPAVWFLYALTYSTGDVVKNGLPIGAKLTTTPSLVVGSGPWMLKNHTWKYRSEIDLVPNPYYYGSRTFTLKEMHIIFTGSDQTMLAGYKSGQFPMSWLPTAEVASYRGQPEFHDTVVEGDLYLTLNVTTPPFNNIHFRKAVNYAIDREAIANGVDHGTVHALYSWYPKGILGYDPTIKSQPGVPYYNPTIARSELALAMKSMKTIPPIALEYENDISDRGREAAEIQANLKAIGINISLHPVPRQTWISDGNSGKTPFMISDWYQDYPDPQDFSDYLIETGAAENWGRYSNPTVDALIKRADAERDQATRERLYKQVQLIVLRDASVAMLYQIAQQAVISTKIHGLELNPNYGHSPQPVGNNWANVTVSP